MVDTRMAKNSRQRSRHRENGQSRGRSSEQSEHKRGHASPWEWAVAAVSAVVVLGAIGLMLYEALAGASTPPDMEVRVDEVTQITGGYLVQLQVRNVGQSTAAEVTVEGELKNGEQTVETSETTIDYVPAEATRSGGLFFTENPAMYTLEVRALGYDEP